MLNKQGQNYEINNKLSEFEAFPKMEQMIDNIFKGQKDLYFEYRDYSNFLHGNIIYNFTIEEQHLNNSLMVCARMVLEIIKMNDSHINNGHISEEVTLLINCFNKRLENLNKELNL